MSYKNYSPDWLWDQFNCPSFCLFSPQMKHREHGSTGGETCRISLVQWVRRARIYTLTYKTATHAHTCTYTHTHTTLPVAFKNRELCHYTWRRQCVCLHRLNLWTASFIFDWTNDVARNVKQSDASCCLGRIQTSHPRRIINQITVVFVSSLLRCLYVKEWNVFTKHTNLVFYNTAIIGLARK